MRIIAAFLRRDAREQRTYRLSMVAQGAAVVLSVVSLYFLARLVPASEESLKPYGSDYFSFALIGAAAATFVTVGLGGFGESLGREQSAGTLEALLVTPNDARVLLLAGAAFPIVLSAVEAGLYLVIGALFFGAHVPVLNLALVIAVEALAIAAYCVVGILAAAILLVVKRGGGVIGLATYLFTIAGGVIFPVTVMPRWLQALAHTTPITYGLDGVRRALLSPPDLGTIALDVAALAGFCIVLLPLAFTILGWSVDRTRRDGTVAVY